MKTQIEKKQKEFIYLLLKHKDLVEKWISEEKVKIEYFETEFRKLAETIKKVYVEEQVLLSKGTYKALLESDGYTIKSVCDAVGQYDQIILYSQCEKDDYVGLQNNILVANQFNPINDLLDTILKYKEGDIEANSLYEVLQPKIEKIKPKDNSIYSKIYESFLPYRKFPDIFSDEIKQALYYIKKKYGCAEDFVYNPFLFALSSAIGSRVKIKARGKFNDAKLWGMSIGTSSKGKSEPAKDTQHYFSDIEKQLHIEYEQEYKKYKNDRIKYETELARYKRNPEKSSIPIEIVEPVQKDIFFEWCTIEAAYRTVQSNPERIMLRVQEFFPWFNNIAKFNGTTGSANFAELQQFYDNIFDDPIKVKRRKKEDTLTIKKHYLVMYNNVQPDLLPLTLFNPMLIHSGFIHRLIYFYPDDVIYKKPSRQVYDIPQKQMDYINTILENIMKLPLTSEWSEYKTIYLDDDNQNKEVVDLHYNYFCTLDLLEQKKELPSVVCANIGRHKMHFSKFILILHLLDCVLTDADINVIKKETVEKAIKLDTYYIAHFLRLYDMFIKTGKAQENNLEVQNNYDRVLQYIKSSEYRTVREIQASQKIAGEEVRKILIELEKNGIGKTEISNSGRNKNKINGFRII